MDKIVKDFLSTHGYRDCVDENQEKRVNEWLDIFKGPTKKYNIKIYNGKNYTKYKIKSLNLPSQICGDLADFFFNEKLDITIDKEKVQKKIKDCLEQNKFLHNGNKLMQLVKALGTGALVPYLDNGVLRINYVNATNIIILKANADEVIDVLFWSKTKTKDGYEYYFNLHVLEEDGYVIYNAKQIETGKDVKDIDHTIRGYKLQLAKERKQDIRIGKDINLKKYATLTEIEKRKSISYLARTKYTWDNLTPEAKQLIMEDYINDIQIEIKIDNTEKNPCDRKKVEVKQINFNERKIQDMAYMFRENILDAVVKTKEKNILVSNVMTHDEIDKFIDDIREKEKIKTIQVSAKDIEWNKIDAEKVVRIMPEITPNSNDIIKYVMITT